MAKVFISYSRKDIEFAKRLTAELQKSDLEFWVDWEGIPPTVDWWREIEKGIEEADAFLFLISPDSSVSKVCGQEIDHAVKNSKRIIPLMVREDKGVATPPQLNHLNWIFFREQGDFAAGIQKLLTSIRTDYDWVQAHRRLQMKALEWERNGKESGFLLRGKDLLDAESNLALNTSKEPHPTDLQREYVLQSRKATDKQRRLLTGISIAGVITLAALAVFGFVQAENAQNAQIAAEKEARRAIAGKLALESKTALDDYPQRALLLALEAVNVNQAADEPVSPEAEEALRAAVERVPGIRLDGFDNQVSLVHFTKDKDTWLVAAGGVGFYLTVGEKMIVRIWNVDKLSNDPSAYQPFSISLPEIPGESSWIESDAKKVNLVTSLESENRTDLLVSISPQETWLTTMAETGYNLWLIADEDETRTPIHFDTLPIFVSENDDTLVMEKQDGRIVLWRVDPSSMQKREVKRVEGEYSPDKSSQGEVRVLEQNGGQLILWAVASDLDQKQEVKRFEGEYVMSSPENEYIVVKDLKNNLLIWDTETQAEPKALNVQADLDKSPITFDPHDRWFIVFQNVIHPEILVPEMDDFRVPTGKQIPWNSTTVQVFSLSDLDAQPFVFEFDQRLNMSAYDTVWRFTPNGNTMLIPLDTKPDEDGKSKSIMNVVYLQGETPLARASAEISYPDWKIINDRWVYSAEAGAFIDLQDNDLQPDASYSAPSDDRYFNPYSYWGSGPELTFTENGKYLVVGEGGRERINFDVLNDTHTLTVETNPDASPSQIDVANLLLYNPKIIGMEEETVYSVTSADGKWAAASASDGSLRLWDYKTPFASSLQMTDDPKYLTLSNDGQWLAIGNSLWELEDGKPTIEHQMKVSEEKFTYSFGFEIANQIGVFSPDSRWFIHLGLSGTTDDNSPEIAVSLLDMTQKIAETVEPTIISQPGKMYNTVQFSPDSKWVVLGGPADAFIFNLENKVSYALPNRIDYAVFTSDRKHIILIRPVKFPNDSSSANNINEVYQMPEVWALPDAPNGILEKTGEINAKNPVTVSRNGRWLMELPVVLTADGTGTTYLKTNIKLWDVNCIIEGYECKPFELIGNKASFSPDSQYLLLGWQISESYFSPTEYEIWDLKPREQDKTTAPVKIYAGSSLGFDPSVGNTGETIAIQLDESCDLFGAPSSTAVLSAGWDKHPWLASLSTFDGYAYLELGSGGGGGGGDSGYHQDYRVDTLVRDGVGYRPITLRGHETSVMETQVSPNERYVLTYSSGTSKDCVTREYLLRLWDMDKMKEDPHTKPVILPLKNDRKTSISHLAFSPNSEWIYVVDSSNTLYYFPTSIETLQQKACLALGRNFIINEWERFFPYDEYRKTCENLPMHISAEAEEPVPTAAP